MTHSFAALATHQQPIFGDQKPQDGVYPRTTKMTHPQCKVTLAEWQAYHQTLSQIRFAVFVQEQHVSEDLERDSLDADPSQVVHVLAQTASGEAIGTARLLLEVPMPRIGRMAVLRAWRGKGVGTAMLEFLCADAKARGYHHVRLNSQTHATPFYYKQGFLSHGSGFLEAGIPHLEMRRELR